MTDPDPHGYDEFAFSRVREGGDWAPGGLFVVRGDETIPSCRFRAYQYADPLRKLGVEVDYFVEGRDRTPLDWPRTTARLLRAASRPYGAIVYQKRLQPERIRLLRRRNPRGSRLDVVQRGKTRSTEGTVVPSRDVRVLGFSSR